MEIHLLLEGEKIGPLSEAQVRQYLEDGLVAPTDLASYEGMEDWLPLELVLAHLPSFAPTPETVSPPAPAAETSSGAIETGAEDAPFLLSENESGSLDTEPLASATETAPSLTASQKTKRKLSKIVIQPILPLETTLPLKRKTGKTTLTLEPLRSTISLPPVTGYQPTGKTSGKGAVRTGKVSLRAIPEQPEAMPAPAPSAPVVSGTASVIPPGATASQKLPDPMHPPSALQGETGFVPPAVSVTEPRRLVRKRFPYAGAALALFLVGVIAICIYLFALRGGAAPAPNPFAPQNAPAPPTNQSSIQVPEAGPSTAADFSNRGIKRQAAGDLDGAIQDFNQALALDPHAVEVYYQRGLARQAKRDFPGASADYTQVIALNPKRADAFSNRGFIKQAGHDLDGALADYIQALALNPNTPAAYYNIGLIKVQRGDVDGGIAAYDRAVQLDPHMAFAYYNRGVAKNTEGDVDGAIADYTQALTLNPKISLAFCNRGVARQSKGDADGALADYTQALSLDPTLTDAFYNRGLIKAQKGDLDGATDDDTRAIALDANDALAYDKRGMALMGKGRLDDALADLKKFCDLAPRDPGTDAARLFIWVIATETNANGDADADLSTALLNEWNSTPEDLTSKIAAFLLGHINENDLIANAASPDPSREPGQYCRVWYFAGMKRLLGGDTPIAASYFQKSVETGQKDFSEYAFARAQLQSMNPGREIAARPEPVR
jgi:lipoprotein NlpI